MRMNAVAKHKNFMPKESSKTQQVKKEKAKENYRPRLCCNKCKESKTTLYRYKKDYYCKDCIAKEEK